MAVTQTSSVTWDQAAYEQLAYYALRTAEVYGGFVTVKPTRQSMPGSSVIFDFVTELTPATTALTEDTDITPATMGDSQVTVTLAEYGNGVQATGKLTGVSYLPVDPIMANLIGYNMAESNDLLILTEVMNGTGSIFSGAATSVATLAGTDEIDALDVRKAVAQMRAADAMPFEDMTFVGTIHPHVSYDLRDETGAASWRDSMLYTDANVGRIYNGYIGTFEGIRFIETTRTYSPNTRFPAALDGTDDGAAVVDAYATHIFGRQALAKAYSTHPEWGADPRMVVAPVTDFLRRKAGVGWKHLVGYKVFRNQCLRNIYSASTLGTNA